MVVKSLVLMISEKVGRENTDVQTLVLPPFVQFKNQAKFEVEFKSEVVDLVKMYNFGVLRF